MNGTTTTLLQRLGETPKAEYAYTPVSRRNHSKTLRLLAQRWMRLAKELRQLDAALAELTKQAGHRLLAQFGGAQTAATLLVTAGDNPDRLHSEAALAALCGVSPLEASSGEDHAASPQSWWRSRGQQRALDDLNGENEK